MRMLVMTIKACVLMAATPYLVADSTTPRAAEAEQITTTSATVENVNKEKREVTLKREDGSKVTITVPDTVRNFDQIKAGDTVRAKYTESIALDIRSSSEPPSAVQRQTLRRAPVGARPSGEQTQTTEITATVENINKEKREVTLLKPDGDTTEVKVPEDVKKFDTLKKGDQVVVTATQSLAIDVMPKQ